MVAPVGATHKHNVAAAQRQPGQRDFFRSLGTSVTSDDAGAESSLHGDHVTIAFASLEQDETTAHQGIPADRVAHDPLPVDVHRVLGKLPIGVTSRLAEPARDKQADEVLVGGELGGGHGRVRDDAV